jgi:hypothetical protein
MRTERRKRTGAGEKRKRGRAGGQRTEHEGEMRLEQEKKSWSRGKELEQGEREN